MSKLIDFAKTHWQKIILALLVIVFWHPVIFNNNFFMDDWDFINTFQSGSYSFQYLFAPHNEHLMPIFKSVFFVVLSAFGTNIVPPMILAILLHILNTILFYILCSFIFKRHKWVPFLATLIWSLNSVYYEVLHWFIVINTALSVTFLMLALIFMCRFFENKNRKDYFISILASFFIPMNFSLGILGVGFIVLFYYGVIKKSFTLSKLKEDLKFLWPYLAVWVFFLVIYYFTIYLPVTTAQIDKNFVINLNPQVILQFVTMGFLGTVIKSLALNILSHSVALLLGILLLLNLLFWLSFFALYFILNRKENRTALLGDYGIALFALGGALLSYAVLALARSFVTADALLNWGRYHYFPYFFLCIQLGNFLPAAGQILSKIFNPRRIKIYAGIFLIVFLLIHLITIHHKAFSLIRTEGLLENSQKINS